MSRILQRLATVWALFVIALWSLASSDGGHPDYTMFVLLALPSVILYALAWVFAPPPPRA